MTTQQQQYLLQQLINARITHRHINQTAIKHRSIQIRPSNVRRVRLKVATPYSLPLPLLGNHIPLVVVVLPHHHVLATMPVRRQHLQFPSLLQPILDRPRRGVDGEVYPSRTLRARTSREQAVVLAFYLAVLGAARATSTRHRITPRPQHAHLPVPLVGQRLELAVFDGVIAWIA